MQLMLSTSNLDKSIFLLFLDSRHIQYAVMSTLNFVLQAFLNLQI